MVCRENLKSTDRSEIQFWRLQEIAEFVVDFNSPIGHDNRLDSIHSFALKELKYTVVLQRDTAVRIFQIPEH